MPEVTVSRQVRESGLVIISLSGDLDTAGTHRIKDEFAVAVETDRTAQVLIDLRGVSFVTSAALALIIVHAQSLSRGGGQLHLAGGQDIIMDIFTRAGFPTLLPTYPTLEEAFGVIESVILPRIGDSSEIQPKQPRTEDPFEGTGNKTTAI